MGGGSSKSSEVVKAEEFTQSSLTDESFSILNLHTPSGFGGASKVLVILGLSCASYVLDQVVGEAEDRDPEGCYFP